MAASRASSCQRGWLVLRGHRPHSGADGSGLVTVGDLLFYYSHLDHRQDAADALSNQTLLFYLGSSKRLTKVMDLTPVADLSEPWVLAVRGLLFAIVILGGVQHGFLEVPE